MKRYLKSFLCLVCMLALLLPAWCAADADTWTCTNGHQGNTGNYCTRCGLPRNDSWTCSGCGTRGNTDAYCPTCGRARSAYANRPSFSVNDIVQFGAYPQSNISRRDPIQWRILDISSDGQYGLLMSIYGLDKVDYHTARTSVTWETSYVRAWLNTTFYQSAFTLTEQSAIRLTRVRNDANPYYPDTPAGRDTDDYVFLLSVNEALTYLPNRMDRCIPATEYAFSRGAYRNRSGDDYSWWWLRSPGRYPYTAARARGANTDAMDRLAGDLLYNEVDDSEDVVIPCLWVNLAYVSAPSGGTVSRAPAVTNPYVTASLKMRLSTRTGPSTSYDEPGTFFSNTWQQVTAKVFSKAQGNGVWWLQVEFTNSGKKYRVYTGLKRLNVDINAIPEETAIGTGYVTGSDNVTGYYGPGTDYAPISKKVPLYSSISVWGQENGYCLVDFYDYNTNTQRRAWIPAQNVVFQ